MKKTKIYLIVLSLLVVLAAYLFLSKDKDLNANEEKAFQVENVEDLSKINLTDRQGFSITLVKKEDHWHLESGENVKVEMMSQLLETLSKMQAEYPVPNVAHDNVMTQMIASSTKVSLYKNGNQKAYKIFNVGGPNHTQDGTYMLMEKNGQAASKPYIVKIPGKSNYLTYRFTPDANAWKSTLFCDLLPDEVKSVAVNYLQEDAKESFVITRNQGAFSLNAYDKEYKNEEVNGILAEQLFTSFLKLHFEKYIENEPKKDSIIQNMTYLDFKITTHNEEEYDLAVYYMPLGGLADIGLDDNGNPIRYDVDRMYAINKETEQFISIQYYTFGKLFLKANQLLKAEQ